MNLYHVQDNDRPMYVAGASWIQAIEKWKLRIAIENACCALETVEPRGVSLIAENCNDDFPEYLP